MRSTELQARIDQRQTEREAQQRRAAVRRVVAEQLLERIQQLNTELQTHMATVPRVNVGPWVAQARAFLERAD